MSRIPQALKEAVEQDKCIVFVGAGLSYDLVNIQGKKIGGWGNMVREILDELHCDETNSEIYKPLLERDGIEPIQVLELMEYDKKIEKEPIYKFLKDFFDVDDDRNDFETHKKVAKLSNKIITTNYDTAFEIIDRDLKKNKAYKGKNYELTRHKDSNNKLLFKLHGCYEDSDSMVLFPSNYRDLYENKNPDAEHSLLVLRNIIYNNTVLFIGTGMGDFQINSIFKYLGSLQKDYAQKHFIITDKKMDSTIDFLEEIMVDNYGEIDDILDELNEIKESIKTDDDNQIDLTETSKKMTELENKLIRTKDDLEKKELLLEREAYEHYSKGIRYGNGQEFEEAIFEYKRTVELKENFHQAFNNLGIALAKLGRQKSKQKAEPLFIEAISNYEKSLEIKPSKDNVHFNWGNVLKNIGSIKEGVEAENYYRLAFEKYEVALNRGYLKDKVYHNYGTGCVALARTKEGHEAKQLVYEGIEKYKCALKENDQRSNTYDSWGCALRDLAKYNDHESAQIYREALEKFDQSLKINSSYKRAANNLQKLIEELSDMEGEEIQALYVESLEKYKEYLD